jgi:hypothetical protein
MTRRIMRLIEEQEDKLKKLRTIDRVVEAKKMQEDLKNLSIQESRAPTPDRKEVLPLNLMTISH